MLAHQLFKFSTLLMPESQWCEEIASEKKGRRVHDGKIGSLGVQRHRRSCPANETTDGKANSLRTRESPRKKAEEIQSINTTTSCHTELRFVSIRISLLQSIFCQRTKAGRDSALEISDAEARRERRSFERTLKT